MSRYGQRALKRLRFQYCDWWGSSQGIREFIEHHLPAWKEQNRHIKVETTMKRNHFPFIEAEYALPHSTRTVGVKHRSPKDISDIVWWLRCSQGYNTRNRIPMARIISKQPSVQGSWTISTFVPSEQRSASRQSLHS
eukprot:jgi/Chrzof1/9847/Cz04g18060.t1